MQTSIEYGFIDTSTMPSKDFPNVPASEHMTDPQLLTLTVLERTGGCISLVAVFAIFIAYWLIREVRNVQNTFIVFASVSNVGASIASTIAMDGLKRGRDSSLCQAQSFMFEMLMQSDPWWALAMAVNVFLVFYFRASPDSFQKWWWLYCLICYGGPFIIALTLLLIRNPERGSVYGEATIWCWVDREWDDIRIYSYYMLIWICIVGSLVLYFMVGYHVFHSRNQLRSFSTVRSRDRDHEARNEESPRINLPNVPEEGFYGTVITEVQVIHSTASSSTIPCSPTKRAHMPTVSFEGEHENQPAASQYYSTVTSVPVKDPPPPPSPLSRMSKRVSKSTTSILNKFVVADPIKRAYLRTSFLFALSVLVTWIPSSMNRIHSWLTGESPYEYHVATAAVLPLQGLWNAVIFFVTSQVALKKGWAELRYGKRVAEEEDMVMTRRSAAIREEVRDGLRESSDGDVGTLGSDVELRTMAEEPGKRSSSL